MERREFETRFGKIWLWGEPDAFSDERPIVLVITGAFNAKRSQVFELQAQVPEAAVLIGHLPGNHCPALIDHSVGIYAAAYSQVLTALARPAISLGASIGGLVTMALQAPNLKGIIAIEPPLRTGKLWPLVAPFRQRMRDEPGNPDVKPFLWAVFGISEDALEDRSYEGMLAQLTTPTRVVLGDEPLYPQREIGTRLPSLVDERERQLFRDHPYVRTTVVTGAGHNVPAQAFAPLVAITKGMVDRVLRGAAVATP
jgi:pimeloyl-ACP methyl ester carboxylesterase